MSTIYVITNTINQKQYVGKTSYSIEKRWKEHCYDCKKNKIDQHRPLYNAMQKYGIENFVISILEDHINEDEIDDREKFWISKLDTYYHGYNATLGGDGQSRIDKYKLKELYDKGYNNKEIASIMGHERSNISKMLKSMGLKSNFSPEEKITLVSPKGLELTFNSVVEAAQYLINKNITRSKNIDSVAGMISKRKYDQKPYFGYYCKQVHD